MRTGHLRKDGSVDLSLERQTKLTSLNRYLRFKAGESIIEIAQKDNLEIEIARLSIATGRKMYESEQILILRDLKYTSAIEGERIRTETRIRVAPQIIDGLELLLKGKRKHVSVRKSTGEFIFVEVDDPEMISMGIEHARKILSLDERPAQNQTVVNIQNNQQNITEGNQGGSTGLSYEERLKRIQNAQKRTVGENDVIDVTPETPVTPIATRLESEETPQSNDEEWGDF